MAFTFKNRELVVNLTVEEVSVVEGIASTPSSGKCKVKNIVFDPETGDTDVEYNDQPEE